MTYIKSYFELWYIHYPKLFSRALTSAYSLNGTQWDISWTFLMGKTISLGNVDFWNELNGKNSKIKQFIRFYWNTNSYKVSKYGLSCITNKHKCMISFTVCLDMNFALLDFIAHSSMLSLREFTLGHFFYDFNESLHWKCINKL